MTKTFLIDTDCFIDSKLFKHYFETMPPERQKKINRLIPVASKRLSLGAGVALSAAVADFGLSGVGAEIQYNEKVEETEEAEKQAEKEQKDGK